MVEYELSLPILVGAAFAGSYWLLNALIAVFPAGDREAMLLIGPGLGVLSAGFVGLASARQLAEGGNLVPRTAIHALTWIGLFAGMAVLVTYTVAAVASLFWGGTLETTLWFGMVLVSTTGLGTLFILAGGGYHLVLQPRAKNA